MAPSGPLRLLCVDDDRVNALLLEQACLQVGNIAFEVAASGADALELAPRWRPELLVIDLHLPDIDGCALLPRLRRALGDDALPAVLCTAEHPRDVAAAAYEVGFQQCWSKPVRLADLQASLRQLAAGHAGG